MYPWQVIKYFNGNVNMNHHGEDPDNLGGLGDMLPADVLKKLNNLLEQLHRAEHPQPGSNIINIYTSGNQHIDNQYVFDGKVLEKSFKTNQREGESKSEIPPPEAMVWAVEKTVNCEPVCARRVAMAVHYAHPL